MSKASMSHEQQLDDQLAEFTDQVLSGSDKQNVEEVSEHDELAELRKMVLRMKSAAQKARTNVEADVRIRRHLMMEWKKVRQTERQKSKGFNWNWNLPRIAFVGGFVVLILISVVTLLIPAEAPLTAASGELQNWTPLLAVLGVVIIILIFWHNRHE